MSRFSCEVINTLSWLTDINYIISESISMLGNHLNLVIRHLTCLLHTNFFHWDEEGEEWSQKVYSKFWVVSFSPCFLSLTCNVEEFKCEIVPMSSVVQIFDLKHSIIFLTLNEKGIREKVIHFKSNLQI